MPFMLKKFISALLLPLPICILLAIIGLLIWWLTRCHKLAGSMIVISIILLALFSTSFLPNILLSNLEYRYKPLHTVPEHVSTIVVLGGGVGGQVGFPANTRLNSASLSRLVEGIRLYRQLSHKGITPKLILSGGRVFRSPTEAGRMRNTAVILGVDRSNISLEDGSRDTHHEALYLMKQLGAKPFILVTSAYHMPRAMALFEKQGMHPIAAPTQYMVKLNRNPFKYYIPSTINLIYSDIALHEYFGIAWARMKGWV